MTVQLDILSLIAEGERLRDEGIALAESNAGEDWAVRVFTLFKQWLSGMPQGAEFRTETFRLWVKGKIEDPPSLRAFGGLAVRAANQGLIRKIGHDKVLNPAAHRCYATLWTKV